MMNIADKLKLSVETITPEIARKFLSKNKFNRPLRQSRVAFYAGQIERGEWRLNGEPFIFAEDGTLLSAQHRCHGIILADTPIETVVVRGVDKDAFDTLDQGAKRTAGDVLAIRGESNYNALASVAALYHKWTLGGNPYHGSPRLHPSIKQIEYVLDQVQGIRESVHWAVSARWCRKFLTPSFAGFSRCVFSEHNEDGATTFFDQLETGVGLYQGSPILMLRERLAQDHLAKERITNTYRAALTFKAFKYHLDGASVKTLRVRTEGEAVEKDLFYL